MKKNEIGGDLMATILVKRGNYERIKGLVPQQGEPLYALDTFDYVTGDGVHTFEQLVALNPLKIAIEDLASMTFTGTYAEYEAAYEAGKIPEGAIVNIIDDSDGGAETATMVVSKLPLASAGYRGRILTLAGDPDLVYVCLNVSGKFAWYNIPTTGSGLPDEGGDPEDPEVPDTPTETDELSILGTGKLGYIILGKEK
jgi:hypothetical protein